MKRPLAYITAPWSENEFENTENAAKYCRAVYDAGFSPICPTLFLPLFLRDEIPQEHKDCMSLYNTGTRTGLIAALEEMRGYLAADETELRELTDSAIAKLRRMSDAEYDALDLFPDFEKEDMDAE